MHHISKKQSIWEPLGSLLWYFCCFCYRSVHKYWLTDVPVGSMNSFTVLGGQSVNKHLIRDLPPGPLCAHYSPKGRPVNQYSSHNKNSATFNILQKNNQFCMVNIEQFLAKSSTPKKEPRCDKYHWSPMHTSAYIYICIFTHTLLICLYIANCC